MRETIRTGVLAAVSVAFLAMALLMLNGCETDAKTEAPLPAATGKGSGY